MRILENSNFKFIKIAGRLIIVGGIGKMYYQEGFPMSIAAKEMSKKGIEVSWFHIADELLRNGFKPERALSRIKEDIADSAGECKVDIEAIEKFIFATYEDSREMIFNYLFKSREEAMEELRNFLKPTTSLQ